MNIIIGGKLLLLRKIEKTPESEKYRNRYGKICADGSRESHLAPLDKKYDFR